jgi:hypothetical protein
MNAKTTFPAIKDEVWFAIVGVHFQGMTRTHGEYDVEGPSFLGDRDEARERCQRFAECVTALVGVDDPVAEMSRLRQIEQRWNAVHDAQARTVALLGDGVGSILPDHQEASKVAAAYEDVQRGPAPWIVVECWPAPLLFLTGDGVWAGSVQKAEIHFCYDDAVDRMSTYGGEIIPLEWMESQGGVA